MDNGARLAGGVVRASGSAHGRPSSTMVSAGAVPRTTCARRTVAGRSWGAPGRLGGSVRPLRAGSDFDQEPAAAERVGVRSAEEDWRQSVRERVARNVAEEASQGMQEQESEEDSDLGLKQAASGRKYFSAVTASTALFGTAAVMSALANALGVDVFVRFNAPAHPVEFAASVAAWTLPAVGLTAALWYYVFFKGEGQLERIFRNEALEHRTVVQGETAGSMALSAMLIACAEGLVFRGTGIAVATDMFAGMSLPTEPTHILGVDGMNLQLLPQHHLPTAWVWPSIVLGAAALEATVQFLSTGGPGAMNRRQAAEMLCQTLMTETTEVQYAAVAEDGTLEMKKGGQHVAAKQISAGGLSRAVAKFGERVEAHKQQQEWLYANPAICLSKALFLSSEVVLTNSLLAGLITGAACEAVQALFSMSYIKSAPDQDTTSH